MERMNGGQKVYVYRVYVVKDTQNLDLRCRVVGDVSGKKQNT